MARRIAKPLAATRKMKIILYIKIILLIFVQANSFCQTLPMTKEEIAKHKIETISYKAYSLKDILLQINIVSYDKTGKLVFERNRSTNEEADYVMDFMKDAIDFTIIYEYDLHNNLILESISNNFFPMTNKWEFEYDTLNRKIKKTTFNLHNEINQTYHYFYGKNSQIVKDSITQNGMPLFVTKYIYEDDKLVKAITERSYKVKHPISDIDDYYYNNKDRLIKIASFRSFTDEGDITDNFDKRYKYNLKGKLVEEKFTFKKFKYLYNKEGLIYKRYRYEKVKATRPRFKKVEYDIIEYTFYN